MTDHFDDARAARDADIEALADMDDDQLGYLASVAQLPDPDTDDLDCGDAGI